LKKRKREGEGIKARSMGGHAKMSKGGGKGRMG